jgi:hypothetical protein
LDRPTHTGLRLVAALALCACGGGSSAQGSGNDASSPDATHGGVDASGDDAGDAGGVDGAPADAVATDAVGKDADAGATGDAGPGGGQGDSGCTPPVGASYACGPAACNGATSFCLETIGGDTCKSLPAACDCANTRDCACLLANVANPCATGTLQCSSKDDGGLLWAMALECP